ncbi:MAG TPA: serine hydrolase domain-containing protein [Panacibacter sp.]|nr:serine hydrolase domain-containing protein [Panacibacter sp.]HNP44078.1 serine hydrolase domain-containing protein [Panacibacter sp.]
MQSMRLPLAATAFLFFCSCNAPEQQKTAGNDKALQDTIKMVEDNLSGNVLIEDSVNTWNIEKRMAEMKVHGLSIAVIHDYKVAWTKGYGFADTAAKTPVTDQTLFQAASISKSLNGVGILKLAQDKKLDLLADINNYLTTWKFPYDTASHGKKISTLNLLSHTGGLTVHGFGGYEPGDSIPTIPQILDGKKPANSPAVRSMYEPGLKSEYSGGGITISQLILQDITKQAYDTYMQENVLDPMGMTSSTYRQPVAKDKEKYLATGYRDNGEAIKGKYHIYPEQAAAGLWTNPADLAKYIIETQLSLQGKPGKVLNTEMTKLRLTPYIDSNAALGVFIVTKGGEKYFSHGGSNEGFRSQYYGSFEGGNGVVVMVNSDDGGILEEVVASVAKVYGWKGFYTPKTRKAIAVTDSMMKPYLGDYYLHDDTLTISMSTGRPRLVINHSFGYDLYFATAEDFFARELNFDLKFEKDAKGQVTDIYFKTGREQRAKRK